MSAIPKVIYFTYKKLPPLYVFHRWKTLNPAYRLDLSLDRHCIAFLYQHFGKDIADMFKIIPKGMYKADLWRICKLYVYGGVYADIDLVPYVTIDSLIKTNNTFYSCLAAGNNGIFQAFMMTPSKNPLLLAFIHSFINNKPWTYGNGPTHDMYNCIKYNLQKNNIPAHIEANKLYNLNNIRITINVGMSSTNEKHLKLYNFSNLHDYTFITNIHNYTFEIRENVLIVKKQAGIDNIIGWNHNMSVDICINSHQSINLFKEQFFRGKYIVTAKGKQIFDSRDPNYQRESSNFNTIPSYQSGFTPFNVKHLSINRKFSIRNNII